MTAELHDPDQCSNRFEYESLLADSSSPTIRLLVLWPRGAGDSRIRCSLSEHYLTDCPSYETLSYNWGRAQERNDIVCNGQCLSITASLHQALKYLRNSEERLLWIDQISINQNDDQEKSHQVSMMREIYQRSSRTIAWLGNPGSSTEEGFNVLKKLYEAGVTALQNRANNAWAQLDLTDPNCLKAIKDDPQKYWNRSQPGSGEETAIDLILSSPWFTRIWIIQEATVSEQLLLVSGPYSMDLNRFIFAVYVFYTLNHWDLNATRVTDGGGFNMLRTLAFCRYSHHSQDLVELDIVRLLYQCRLFQASDDRDRLYALYGLTSTFLPDLGLTTDYTQSARSVLTSSYAKLMHCDQSLRLLELSETDDDSDLPSWIPIERGRIASKLHPQSSLRENEAFEEGKLFLRILRDTFADNCEILSPNTLENPLDPILEQICNQQGPAYLLQPARNVCEIELLDDGTLCVQGQLLDKIAELSPVLNYITSIETNQILSDADSYFDHFYDQIHDYASEASIDKTSFIEGMKDVVESRTKMFKAWIKAEKQGAEALDMTKNFIKTLAAELSASVAAQLSVDVMVTSRKQTAYYPSEAAIRTAYRNTVSAGALALEDGDEMNMYSQTAEEAIEQFENRRARLNPVLRIDKLKKRLGMSSPIGSTSALMYYFKMLSGGLGGAIVTPGEALIPLTGRRIAWTTRGHLALVPARTSVGDHVFALRASRRPFVLRSHSGNWKVVGPAYVDGMMDDELHDEDAIGTVRLV